jgi:23S rRNA pseudoU1915 N3-methylase RlmH
MKFPKTSNERSVEIKEVAKENEGWQRETRRETLSKELKEIAKEMRDGNEKLSKETREGNEKFNEKLAKEIKEVNGKFTPIYVFLALVTAAGGMANFKDFMPFFQIDWLVLVVRELGHRRFLRRSTQVAI